MDYKFIGWCREDNHDKVWVAIVLHESEEAKRYPWGQCKWVTIWGRRGKKLQSKVFEDSISELHKLTLSKTRKGYRKVDQAALDYVYPEFQADLEKTAIWSLLKV